MQVIGVAMLETVFNRSLRNFGMLMSQIFVGVALTGGAVAAYGSLLPPSEKAPDVQPAFQDVTDIWTVEPVKVDTASQQYERIAPRLSTHATESLSSKVAVSVRSGADMRTTQQKKEDLDTLALAEHVNWCSERYRSYDRETDTYRGYSGRVVQCVSPMSRKRLLEAERASAAGVDGRMAGLSSEHTTWCETRYRSYDATNNSYRSFSGQVRPCVSPYSASM